MTYPKLYLYKRIVQAKIFIDENYQNEINVNDIAEEANFSMFHFIRLYKKAYGSTPGQYLIEKRIGFAKRMLESNQRVTTICYESGFSSPGSFSALFKERTGMSPSAFRQNHIEEQIIKKSKPQKFIPGCYLIKSNFREVSLNICAEI